MTRLQLLYEFKRVFETDTKPSVYFAPGRVNLIGEHTDYNGGHVFPCALTMGTYAFIRKREDRKIRFYSMNFKSEGVIETSLDSLEDKIDGSYTNYPKGIVHTWKENGYELTSGFDLMLRGNIPHSSGLSSSASVEVVCGYAINQEYGFKMNMVKLAKLCQYSENHYNGVNCGIMDQFAIAMGKENYAVCLNTSSLKYTYVPIDLSKYKIIIMNTNKKRGLGDSKYNERRAECEEAWSIISKETNKKSFGDLTEDEWTKLKFLLPEQLRKRANHCVTENLRTLKAVSALENNDINYFGKLMNKSHCSLRDDYEVSGKELDTLVSSAWKQRGVIGARMIGAGFGGCAVAIVEEQAVKEFEINVGNDYVNNIGYKADFYVVEVGGGPTII